MKSHHSVVACKAIPSRPATIVSVCYDTDNQLRSTIVSGSNSRHYTINTELPDEGVYVIYQSRALQIAAPPCDKRKCNTSHLCRCDTPQFAAKSARLSRRGLKKRAISWPVWKPCRDCLFNWLRLYQATEAANRLDMQCLQHPRTLTWANMHGNDAFHYDSELEDQTIRCNRNGNSLNDVTSRSAAKKTYCSRRLFEWMNGAWSEFAESGCCKPSSIAAVSEYEDESYRGASGGKDRQESSESDSEWDDLDIPCENTRTSSGFEDDGFDFINDIIDTEFPKLRESDFAKHDAGSSSQTTLHPPMVNSPDEEEEEGISAPAIIPPKNMSIGQGLRTPPQSPVLTPTQSRNSSMVYILDRQRFAGIKRSFLDLMENGNDDEMPPLEDIPRVKQQKRDVATLPRTGSTHSTRRRSFGRLGPVAKRVVFV